MSGHKPPSSATSAPAQAPGPVSHAALDAFFEAGGLTVYASSASSWRWQACAGRHALEAVLIDPQALIDDRPFPSDIHPDEENSRPPRRRGGKPFEHSRLVKWLSRAAEKRGTEKAPASAAGDPENGDFTEISGLLGLSPEDGRAMDLQLALTPAEIRHFAQAHNAALSDIESAFLPGRFDLPPALTGFYIRHLTQARRDAEAAFLVAQSSGSLRVPAAIADALAARGFEAALDNPVRHEGNDYAASVITDTAVYIDEAVGLAEKMLALPIGHPGHLLRLDLHQVTGLATDIVARLRPAPFAFLLKAKELHIARSDVSRFPPEQRLPVALGEGDLPFDEPWVRRLVTAYERIFEAAPVPAAPAGQGKKILSFVRS